ncbi:MAG: hypothetical protein C0505_15970, partial [Leptothrix sp. (in: Bacteria)]|nr:hypothetical protein [Leptothrix sp. (in: b-proteobacteria)]
LVDGVRTGTVGRVSMDMLAVDLTPVPAAGIGSEVTLWGHGPGGSILSIDDVARAATTIGYELMCAVAPRVPVRTGSVPAPSSPHPDLKAATPWASSAPSSSASSSAPSRASSFPASRKWAGS